MNKFKPGDWVRLNDYSDLVWSELDNPQPPLTPSLKNVIFVIESIDNCGDYHVKPHDVFAGMFRVDSDGNLFLGDTIVFDFYYPEELVLVESFENED